MRNIVTYKVRGKYALFTDPVTKIGGEKFSMHIPTYEALKGITKSIYWKPTFIWVIDKVRVMKCVQTQTKGMKPLKFAEGGNDLSIYSYLKDVEYQVQAHIEWNRHRPELACDRNDGKHHTIASNMIKKGGRQDIFLGVRDCQGYVEPCEFGEGKGFYDDQEEISYGYMFHGFDYPDEIGESAFYSRFWIPVMKKGVIEFCRPEACAVRKFIREMKPKEFAIDANMTVNEVIE